MFHSFRSGSAEAHRWRSVRQDTRPHPFFVGRAIGPVRALHNRARGLESEADAVVEIAIRVPFNVYINRRARITPRDFAKRRESDSFVWRAPSMRGRGWASPLRLRCRNVCDNCVTVKMPFR